MALENYKKKRKFKKTPEPKGQAKTKGLNRFVVHKHQATNLHYDFRLELPASVLLPSPSELRRTSRTSAGKPEKINQGKVVLKSWAVPKGIPETSGVKHLAVQVEDHPVEYINFKGIIPAGNYGAGKVEIWDKGRFKLLEATDKSLKLELKGKVLAGKYILFNFSGKNWFLFKMKD